MKKIDLFDTFENAEDELMEDFTDMSPKIDDEQFEKLLAVSERNYKMKKEEIERTKKDNNIDHDADSVSGVDRVKRPVWLTPLITAASLVLVTGAVIGSVLLLNRNGNGVGGNDDFLNATTSTAVSTAVEVTETTTVTNKATGTGTGKGTVKSTSTTKAVTTAVAEGTTTEPTSDPVYTQPAFVEPQSDGMFFDESLGNIALELCKKEEYKVSWALTQGAVRTDISDYIEFSVDPSVIEEWNHCFVNIKDGTSNTDNKVYFIRVNENDYDTLKEMEEYGRSVYAKNHKILEHFHNCTGYIPDEMEQGDQLSKDLIKEIVEYRGKLYKLYRFIGIGYLDRVYHEEYPVIIADKTDTSFRAFIPFDRMYDDSKILSEKDMELVEMKLVMDPEYNDWRIESNQERYDVGLYKKLADKVRG